MSTLVLIPGGKSLRYAGFADGVMSRILKNF